MSYAMLYLKRSEADRGENWLGSLADATERGRRAVRSDRADQVTVIKDGKTAFPYPEVADRLWSSEDIIARIAADAPAPKPRGPYKRRAAC